MAFHFPFRIARVALHASSAALAAGLISAAALSAQPLTLAQALALAESRSPQLAAQAASAQAAAALVGPAGENPDPKLIFGVENVPVDGADKWSLTADGMTMRRVGVMQDFVRPAKRALMTGRAQAEAKRESALAAVQLAELRRDVAMAWFERRDAIDALAFIDALVREAELQLAGATAGLAAGKSAATDPIAARQMQAGLADRRLEIERGLRRAEARLARWLGDDARRPAGAAPDIGTLPHGQHALLEGLEDHPHLAMYAPMAEAADAEAELARKGSDPDWSVELTYGQRGAQYSNMVSLMVRMDLPLFAGTRQDPRADSKAKEAARVRAQAEEARRSHETDVRVGLVDWDNAKARLERQETQIVPLAEERARAALAAYEGARGDLAMVLEARRMLVEARLAALAARSELARSWAQLAYLLPERTSK